jgi:NADPH2:quinone reductase
MKAIVISKFGSEDEFQEVDHPRPKPGASEVLIRVAATSVNPLDFKLRRGDFPDFAPSFPAILHSDVAGIVEEVGSQVTRFKAGDRVYGCAGGVRGRQGALAEYMLADHNLIALAPRTLSLADAATLPLVAITAWEGIVDAARIQAGESVLIHGGTGGVGHVALQLAIAAGARVCVTVGSQGKEEIARALGADAVVNYKKDNLAEATHEFTGGLGFDCVFDTVGGSVLEQSFELAGLRGRVLSILSVGSFNLTPTFQKALSFHAVNMSLPMATGLGTARHHEILNHIAAHVDSRQLKPLIHSRRFKMSEAAEAHQLAESGEAVGKISIASHWHE